MELGSLSKTPDIRKETIDAWHDFRLRKGGSGRRFCNTLYSTSSCEEIDREEPITLRTAAALRPGTVGAGGCEPGEEGCGLWYNANAGISYTLAIPQVRWNITLLHQVVTAP